MRGHRKGLYAGVPNAPVGTVRVSGKGGHILGDMAVLGACHTRVVAVVVDVLLDHVHLGKGDAVVGFKEGEVGVGGQAVVGADGKELTVLLNVLDVKRVIGAAVDCNALVFNGCGPVFVQRVCNGYLGGVTAGTREGVVYNLDNDYVDFQYHQLLLKQRWFFRIN